MSGVDKSSLRRVFKQRRNSLDQREQRSAAICERVQTLAAYQAAQVLHCYLPIRSEVDTRPLLASALADEKRVIVPIVRPATAELDHSWIVSLEPDDLELGSFGTLQPRQLRSADASACDIVIVPLLAFDRFGYRLGYGKGYYDRLLSNLAVPTVGVAFAAQEHPALPPEPHDLPLNYIITEHEVRG